MKTITIHQPMYLPYLGFFNKVIQADKFVVLDDVKATKADFTNRNRIRAPNGQAYITIPVQSKNIEIREIQISGDDRWVKKHLKTLNSFYVGTPYFESYIYDLTKIYNQSKWQKIMDLDIELLKWIFNILSINVDIIFSSSLNSENSKTQRLIDICKSLEGDIYISGIGGKNYLDVNLFEKNDLKVVFQNFNHPVYPQKFQPFIPNLSIIDAIFNCGSENVRKMLLE